VGKWKSLFDFQGRFLPVFSTAVRFARSTGPSRFTESQRERSETKFSDSPLGIAQWGALNVDGVAAVAEATQERFGHGAIA